MARGAAGRLLGVTRETGDASDSAAKITAVTLLAERKVPAALSKDGPMKVRRSRILDAAAVHLRLLVRKLVGDDPGDQQPVQVSLRCVRRLSDGRVENGKQE